MDRPTANVIFFAGTDTDVGKTYAAALVAKSFHHSGVSVGVYKPVASGCVQTEGSLTAGDAVALWEAAGRPKQLADVCPQKFVAPLSPTAAADLEGKRVDAELLRRGADAWLESSELLIVEGAGGLMSPLAEGFLNIDLFRKFDGAKLVVVAANRLGVIHQVLATCAAAQHRGVTPAGIILSSPAATSDSSVATNKAEIENYTDVPIVGEVAFGQTQLTDETIGQLSF